MVDGVPLKHIKAKAPAPKRKIDEEEHAVNGHERHHPLCNLAGVRCELPSSVSSTGHRAALAVGLHDLIRVLRWAPISSKQATISSSQQATGGPIQYLEDMDQMGPDLVGTPVC